jgi:hypothetical protein
MQTKSKKWNFSAPISGHKNRISLFDIQYVKVKYTQMLSLDWIKSNPYLLQNSETLAKRSYGYLITDERVNLVIKKLLKRQASKCEICGTRIDNFYNLKVINKQKHNIKDVKRAKLWEFLIHKSCYRRFLFEKRQTQN